MYNRYHVTSGRIEMDQVNAAAVRAMVAEGLTHKAISARLSAKNPGQRGFSEMSVRRFCAKHNITLRSGLSQTELNRMVYEAIRDVRT